MTTIVARIDKAVFFDKCFRARSSSKGKGWVIGLKNREDSGDLHGDYKSSVGTVKKDTCCSVCYTELELLASKFLCRGTEKRFNLDKRHIWSKWRSMSHQYKDDD